MHTTYVVITLTTAVVTAGIAVADLIPAGFVLANSAEVGVPRSWLRPVAAVKPAGPPGWSWGSAPRRPWELGPLALTVAHRPQAGKYRIRLIALPGHASSTSMTPRP